MKNNGIWYFVSGLSLAAVVIWLVIPGPSKFITTPLFSFAAAVSLGIAIKTTKTKK